MHYMKAIGANKLENEQKIALLLIVEVTKVLDVYNAFHINHGGEREKLCRNNANV